MKKNTKIIQLVFTFFVIFFLSPSIFAFQAGDRVKTTTNLYVRSCPAITCNPVNPSQPTEPTGGTGRILDGPYSNDGYAWWRISWDDGLTGYSVDNWLVVIPGYFTLAQPTKSCNGSNPEIHLSWTSSSNATDYDVYRNGLFYMHVLTSLTFDNTANITPGNSYSYFIRALNSNGTQDSNSVTVTAPTCIQPPQITIGPSSLNFGDVQIGSCSSSSFAIQHVSGTNAASGTISINPDPPFSITSNSSFSVSNGQGINAGVQFCPTIAGSFSGSATINSNAIMNINTVNLNGIGVIPSPTNGAIQVNATLDGSPWAGSVNYTINGPVFLDLSGAGSVPADFQNKPQGTYTLSYISGGPNGAAFSSILPSNIQTLSGGGIITFTINFTTARPTATTEDGKWTSPVFTDT